MTINFALNGPDYRFLCPFYGVGVLGTVFGGQAGGKKSKRCQKSIFSVEKVKKLHFPKSVPTAYFNGPEPEKIDFRPKIGHFDLLFDPFQLGFALEMAYFDTLKPVFLEEKIIIKKKKFFFPKKTFFEFFSILNQLARW